jgi:hypothetical protein
MEKQFLEKLIQEMIEKISTLDFGDNPEKNVFINMTNFVERKIKNSIECTSLINVFYDGIDNDWKKIARLQEIEFTTNEKEKTDYAIPLERILLSRAGDLISNIRVSLYEDGILIYKNPNIFLERLDRFNKYHDIDIKNISCEFTFLEEKFLDKMLGHHGFFQKNSNGSYKNLPRDLSFIKSPFGDVSLKFTPIFNRKNDLFERKYKLLVKYDEIYMDEECRCNFSNIKDKLKEHFPLYRFTPFISTKHYNYFEGYLMDYNLLKKNIGKNPVIKMY